uniref:Periphilin-1 C-terminal domain-containing protein n=1 Tax=Amphilophus citrinellus TaxID=61819 RepID=A0A3Q0T2H4_AMPCI
QRHHHLSHRAYVHQREHLQSKFHHIPLRERVRKKEQVKEKEKYEQRESTEGSSSPKQEKSKFISAEERDHRGTKSRERSRDRELPSTVSQTAARDRAIQQKRKEIDEVYYQECEMFGFVVKMLIEKDPSLERSIQSSLQENLRDIGKRCVEAMEKFIEDYDSRELSLSAKL